jgi:transcriptional regulator with XRE-family HTH domain
MNGLKKTRKELGLSQQAMADLLGITRQQLSLFEISKRSMPLDAFMKWNRLVLALQQLQPIQDAKALQQQQQQTQQHVKNLQQKLADIAYQRTRLQRQLNNLQQKQPQTQLLLQLTSQLLQQPETEADRTFQLNLEILRDEALKKAKINSPYCQSELQTAIALLNLHETLLQQQLHTIGWMG